MVKLVLVPRSGSASWPSRVRGRDTEAQKPLEAEGTLEAHSFLSDAHLT